MEKKQIALAKAFLANGFHGFEDAILLSLEKLASSSLSKQQEQDFVRIIEKWDPDGIPWEIWENLLTGGAKDVLKYLFQTYEPSEKALFDFLDKFPENSKAHQIGELLLELCPHQLLEKYTGAGARFLTDERNSIETLDTIKIRNESFSLKVRTVAGIVTGITHELIPYPLALTILTDPPVDYIIQFADDSSRKYSEISFSDIEAAKGPQNIQIPKNKIMDNYFMSMTFKNTLNQISVAWVIFDGRTLTEVKSEEFGETDDRDNVINHLVADCVEYTPLVLQYDHDYTYFLHAARASTRFHNFRFQTMMVSGINRHVFGTGKKKSLSSIYSYFEEEDTTDLMIQAKLIFKWCCYILSPSIVDEIKNPVLTVPTKPLNQLSYRDLQALAKARGIRSNQKKAVLIELLEE
jgi:hypothetical protein